jgi:hypothetical protein
MLRHSTTLAVLKVNIIFIMRLKKRRRLGWTLWTRWTGRTLLDLMDGMDQMDRSAGTRSKKKGNA